MCWFAEAREVRRVGGGRGTVRSHARITTIFFFDIAGSFWGRWAGWAEGREEGRGEIYHYMFCYFMFYSLLLSIVRFVFIYHYNFENNKTS